MDWELLSLVRVYMTEVDVKINSIVKADPTCLATFPGHHLVTKKGAICNQTGKRNHVALAVMFTSH